MYGLAGLVVLVVIVVMLDLACMMTLDMRLTEVPRRAVAIVTGEWQAHQPNPVALAPEEATPTPIVWAPLWILLGLTQLAGIALLYGLALWLSKGREKANYITKITTEVEEALKHFEFERAERLHEELKERYPDAIIPDFEARLHKARKEHKRAKEQEKANYLAKITFEIEEALRHYEFERANQLHEELKERYPDATIPDFEVRVRKAHEVCEQVKANYLARIEEALKHCEFKRANRLYEEFKERYPDATIPNLEIRVRKAREECERANYLAKVEEALRRFEFERADQLHEEFKERYPDATTPDFEDRIRKAHGLFDLLKGKLKCFYFATADELFRGTPYFAREKYENLKKHYIEQYVSEHLPSLPINNEQAKALANTSDNLLVGARAGSGKTRLIAYRAALLLQEGVQNLDKLMILAFNRDAATEIRNRIQREFGFARFGNARTFHSLAHRLVLPKETLLFDEGGNSLFTKKLSLFIQDVLTSIINPAFCEQMYTMFREEVAEVEEPGQMLSEEKYYTYRRSIRQPTLRGELIKSVGEKWIADFLFEHDIRYRYEELYFWDGKHYHPDFSIFYGQETYIIEHWGIDENHREKSPLWPSGKTWEEYRQEMRRKRDYWRKKDDVVLIETSIVDKRPGREHFEAVLKQRLENVGIICNKLPQKQLHEKVQRDHLIRFAKMITQFIQNAKKKGLSPSQMQSKIHAYEPRDERESTFLQLATRVYEKYEQEKQKQNRIDFDDLLMQAAQRVHETEGRCSIRIDHQRDIPMNDLRWIMIDEYQDFSPLFYQLIQSIRRYNPSVRLFCVGDDWQAINAFAGSELTFFERFEEWIGNAEITHLLINHRSQAKIVENSNALMDGGPKAVSLPSKRGGLVKPEPIDDIRIELRENEEAYRADERFYFFNRGKSVNVMASKYAKRCYQIITDPENIGKTVAILSRTNKLHSVSLEDFQRKLIECLNEEEKKAIGKPKDKIQVKTVHSFKGLEAEIVILVRACEDDYPLIHPDNALFTIFGRNEADTIDEEKRLFYVALTRAKEKLYILTERGRESPFLRGLPAYDRLNK